MRARAGQRVSFAAHSSERYVECSPIALGGDGGCKTHEGAALSGLQTTDISTRCARADKTIPLRLIVNFFRSLKSRALRQCDARICRARFQVHAPTNEGRDIHRAEGHLM